MQNAVVTIQITADGTTTTREFVTADNSTGKVGDYIRMRIERKNAGCSVELYSCSEMERDAHGKITPKWNSLFSTYFNNYLNKQGVAATGGDILFSGTRINGTAINEVSFIKE